MESYRTQIINKLIDSIPKRIELVIENEGGYINNFKRIISS